MSKKKAKKKIHQFRNMLPNSNQKGFPNFQFSTDSLWTALLWHIQKDTNFKTSHLNLETSKNKFWYWQGTQSNVKIYAKFKLTFLHGPDFDEVCNEVPNCVHRIIKHIKITPEVQAAKPKERNSFEQGHNVR